MAHEILINVTPQETRVAMLEQGVVQELHVERSSARGLVGNVYLGRVARVLPGMQSAFIEIGLERAAFLHIADIWEHRQNGHGGERPIERILHEGQSLLVQVIKDPIGTKGARLSTQVSLAGRLLVYLPQDSHIGISQRIEDVAERENLREKVHSLIPEGESGGFIVRTVAETATDAELKADIDYLVTLWKQIQLAATTAAPRPHRPAAPTHSRPRARTVTQPQYRVASSTGSAMKWPWRSAKRAVHRGYSSMAKPGTTREVAHQRSKNLPPWAMSSSHGQARFPVARISTGSNVAANQRRRRASTSPKLARTAAPKAGMAAAIRL